MFSAELLISDISEAYLSDWPSSRFLKELKKITLRPVSSGEILRAKEFYLGQLELALEDTMDNMLWIGESTLMLDRAMSLDEIISEVNRVDRADIRQAARKIFNDNNLNLSLIGPLAGIEDKIRKVLFL